MDSDYIHPRLIKLAELLYGKNSDCFSKKKGSYYFFGSKKKKIKNKVSKQIAIHLILP